ncbi:hypothetical protein ACIQGZ_14330 [Streptomyces sp. NPDC092296]|uniref:hypothetical protein n=1 Tax=Streptomyces sp. NPDC092296 TaxID=3366012 RepID=UPI0037FD3D8D
MKKATLRTAGTAALSVAFAAAAAGTAAAAAGSPLGAQPLAPAKPAAGFDASRALPLGSPVAQALGTLNTALGAAGAAAQQHTQQPAQQPVPQQRAGGAGLTPGSHGNSLGGPVGQVLGALGGGGQLLGG